MRTPCLLALATWIATAQAQSFVIVDAANGPGTQFTSIAAAVNSVPSGSTLLVRPGSYDGFDVSGKALTVLGGPGVQIVTFLSPAIRVRNTAVSQPVALHGITVNYHAGAGLAAENCQGRVLVDDYAFVQAGLGGFGSTLTAISATACSQVMVRDSQLRGAPGLLSVDAEVALEGTTVTGIDGLDLLRSPSSAVTITRGSLRMSGCSLAGGAGVSSFPNPPGLTIDQAQVTAMGRGADGIRAGTGAAGGPASAVVGQGSFVAETGLQLVPFAGAPAVAASLVSSSRALPALRSVDGAVGSAVSAQVFGPAGRPVFLTLGFPGLPLSAAGMSGSWWLDPAATSIEAIGTPQNGAPVQASLPVPNLATLRGVWFGWQAVSVEVNATLTASNPALFVLF